MPASLRSSVSDIGAFEAKTHFPELLDRVQKGERITITKRGVPAAMLVPVEESSELRPREAVARLKQIRNSVSTRKRVTIRELIDEGRKY